MKRSITSFLAVVGAAVFSGCSGGVGSSANPAVAATCSQGSLDQPGTVYPKGTAFSIPFSSPTVSGTFDFAAVNFCTQAANGVGTSTPSSDVTSLAALLPADQHVLTYMNLRIGGEAYPNAPIAVHLTLPDSAVGKTIYVYKYYSVYGNNVPSGWKYNYSGVDTGGVLTLPARVTGNDFTLGDNPIAIVSN
jgi:hypothetical protein